MKIDLKNDYRPELDGLRAIAVTAVIINHINGNWLPSGYLGVDIFFVISGYVISSSIERRNSKNFWNFILGFYERRIKRLIPALIFLVIPISLLISLFAPDPRLSLRTGITSLFGFSNLYLLKQSTDYFGLVTELNVFAHTWSLGVEEQFYLVFPLLSWFSGFSSKKQNGSKYLFLVLSFLSIFSLFLFVGLYKTNESLAYFLMPTRFWEIAAGCILFLSLNKKILFKNHFFKISPDFILFLILLTFFLPINLSYFSNLVVVFLTLILIAKIGEKDLGYRLLTSGTLVSIGLISYSLYLWHWSILSISRWTIGIHWFTLPFQLILIYALAKISYELIEKPLRHKSWSLKNWETILKGLFGLIFSGLSIFFVDYKQGNLPAGSEGKLYLGKHTYLGDDASWRNEIESANIEMNGKKCHGDASYGSKQINNLLDNCKIISPNNKKNKTIAFLGDSHVLPLMNAQKLIYKNGFNVIHYSFSGCPFPYPRYGLKIKKCDQFNSKASQTLLNNLRENDYIVIYNYHLSHLGDKSLRDVRHNFYDENRNIPTSGEEKFEIYTEALIDFANQAKSKNIKIIFIGATMRNNLIRISSKEWFRPFPSNQWVYEEEKINANNLNNKLKERFQKTPNIVFVDPLKEMECCKNNEEFFRNFRDTDHLSDYGSDTLIKRIIPIIRD